MLIEFGSLSHCLTPQQQLSLSFIKPIINDIYPCISADDHNHALWKALQFMASHSSNEELARCGIFQTRTTRVHVYVFRHTFFFFGNRHL